MPDEICGRCLVIVNATIPVRAKHPNGSLETFDCPTDPIGLRNWALAKLADENWRIEVGPTTDMFRVFATWHGDPVCVYHLWVLAEAEMRAGYRARALRPR